MKAETRRFFLDHAIKAVGLLGLAARPAWSRDDEASATEEMVTKAVNFLRPRQAEDGSWSRDRKEPGITALVVTALLRSKRVTASEPVVTKALAYLEQFLGPKGGLTEAPHANYTTSIALMAFHEANQDGKYFYSRRNLRPRCLARQVLACDFLATSFRRT